MARDFCMRGYVSQLFLARSFLTQSLVSVLPLHMPPLSKCYIIKRYECSIIYTQDTFFIPVTVQFVAGESSRLVYLCDFCDGVPVFRLRKDGLVLID